MAGILALAVSKAALTCLGFRRTWRVVTVIGHRAPRQATAFASSAPAVLHRSARWAPWESSCLDRSVTLSAWLAWRGVRNELVIAVRSTEGGTADAHAWVEVAGEVVNDDAAALEEFSTLQRWSTVSS